MILYIIRGLQGSGKTTLAESIAYSSKLLKFGVHAEADKFFMHDGVYCWDGAKTPTAHLWCQSVVEDAMVRHVSPVVVSNTFIRRKDMEPYMAMASKYGYSWEIIDLFDGGCSDEELFQRCVHAVPLETIARNRARYEH